MGDTSNGSRDSLGNGDPVRILWWRYATTGKKQLAACSAN
jgi:hypothetical protein